MSINSEALTVSGIEIQVDRKAIKNLHLGVYPPNGRVRVAAPEHVTDENIRLAVISKLGWIRKQQARFAGQSRQSEREMVQGESHYVWGKRYRLEVVERHGPHEVVQTRNEWLTLYVRPNTSRDNREKVLTEWYRAGMKTAVVPLLKKWQPIIDVQINDWLIKKMKTRWGSCNIEERRILLNLELAKKPPDCLEYILVHELVHLLERHHNQAFLALMDTFLPNWQHTRDLLNAYPLAHENWTY